MGGRGNGVVIRDGLGGEWRSVPAGGGGGGGLGVNYWMLAGGGYCGLCKEKQASSVKGDVWGRG